LLGDKSELDESVKELYQKSGIGHVLAISGVCFLCWVFIIGERMA
jgi:predicted membrane metal-binding protein